MANYPEAQKRAQAELDTVVGPHRLPTLDDEKHLPYVRALIRECLRWQSVTPTGVAHVSLQEDEYKGYRIPQGSLVVSNVWYVVSIWIVQDGDLAGSVATSRAYSRDTRHFKDPEDFRPERFLKDGQLDPSVLDPSMVSFGYGRRCVIAQHRFPQ